MKDELYSSQYMEHFYHPQKFTCAPFPVNPCPLSRANNALISITWNRVIPITQSVNCVLLVPLPPWFPPGKPPIFPTVPSSVSNPGQRTQKHCLRPEELQTYQFPLPARLPWRGTEEKITFQTVKGKGEARQTEFSREPSVNKWWAGISQRNGPTGFPDLQASGKRFRNSKGQGRKRNSPRAFVLPSPGCKSWMKRLGDTAAFFFN